MAAHSQEAAGTSGAAKQGQKVSGDQDSRTHEVHIESEELDFCSPNFNPLRALYSQETPVPFPSIKTFPSLSSYEQTVKVKQQQKELRNTQAKAYSGESQISSVSSKDTELVSEQKPNTRFVRQQASTSLAPSFSQRKSDPELINEASTHGKRLPDKAHLGSFGRGRGEIPEAKDRRKESGPGKKQRRNLITRMEDAEGPTRLLTRCVKERLHVRVMTRGAVTVKSICRGYIVAFDKYFNMALMDVDEIYRRPPALGKIRSRRTHKLQAAQSTLQKEKIAMNAKWKGEQQQGKGREIEMTGPSSSSITTAHLQSILSTVTQLSKQQAEMPRSDMEIGRQVGEKGGASSKDILASKNRTETEGDHEVQKRLQGESSQDSSSSRRERDDSSSRHRRDESERRERHSNREKSDRSRARDESDRRRRDESDRRGRDDKRRDDSDRRDRGDSDRGDRAHLERRDRWDSDRKSKYEDSGKRGREESESHLTSKEESVKSKYRSDERSSSKETFKDRSKRDDVEKKEKHSVEAVKKGKEGGTDHSQDMASRAIEHAKELEKRYRMMKSVYPELSAPLSPFEREALMLGIPDENVEIRHLNQVFLRGENVVLINIIDD